MPNFTKFNQISTKEWNVATGEALNALLKMLPANYNKKQWPVSFAQNTQASVLFTVGASCFQRCFRKMICKSWWIHQPSFWKCFVQHIFAAKSHNINFQRKHFNRELKSDHIFDKEKMLNLKTSFTTFPNRRFPRKLPKQFCFLPRKIKVYSSFYLP